MYNLSKELLCITEFLTQTLFSVPPVACYAIAFVGADGINTISVLQVAHVITSMALILICTFKMYQYLTCAES